MMRSIILVVFVFLCMGMVHAQFADKVDIHGFVSQGYLKSTDNNLFGNTQDGTFEFNEFGINFSSELTDDLRVGMQLFARNLGYVGGDQVIFDWAYGDYRFTDWFGVRGGKMRMPLGLYNEIRDIDMLRTNILLPQGVYNESWRETFNAVKGVGIYGTLDMDVAGYLNYQAQAGVLSIGLESGLNKYIEDQLWAHMTDYKPSTTYVGNLNWETPLSGLKLGASVFSTSLSITGVTEDAKFWRDQTTQAIGDVAESYGLDRPETYEEALQLAEGFGVDADLVGIDIVQDLNDNLGYWFSAEFVYNDLKIAGEYFTMNSQVVTSSPEFGTLRDFNNDLGGFYGSIDYRFTDWLEVGSYYTEYYPDHSDKDGKGYEKVYNLPSSNGYLKDLALSLRFDVNSHWIVKAEGHKMNGTAVMFRQDQVDPTNVKEDWYLFAAKLTYNF
jgi:hypothetical protein